jgi:hypothetical protein
MILVFVGHRLSLRISVGLIGVKSGFRANGRRLLGILGGKVSKFARNRHFADYVPNNYIVYPAQLISQGKRAYFFTYRYYFFLKTHYEGAREPA